MSMRSTLIAVAILASFSVAALYFLVEPAAVERVAAAERADIYDTTADGKTLIKEAAAKAKKEDKLVLVVWGANWCGWCHRLHEIMSSGDAKKIVEEGYVVARIDLGDRDKHMDLAREYGLEFNDLGIPHMLILDGDGKIVTHTALRPLAENDDYSPRLVAQYLKKQSDAAKAKAPA